MVNTAIDTKIDVLLNMYRYMMTARTIDVLEQQFTDRGEAFFHVSGAGHEATVVLANFLKPGDWLHCHYRDKALMLARGIPVEMFFLATFNKQQSHSCGRQMNAHMSAPSLHIMSIVGPVGNSALHAVGVAESIRNNADMPIVLCSLGEGMTQQGDVMEAIAHTVRNELPTLFLIEDNSFAISTQTTGQTFYSTPHDEPESFYGIPLRRIDGRYAAEAYDAFEAIVAEMRETRQPAIVIFDVDRLSNHTNADDQRVYRTPEEIEHTRTNSDPIAILRNVLITGGVPEETFIDLEHQIMEETRAIAARVQIAAEPSATDTALKPLPEHLVYNANEYCGDLNAMPKEQLALTMGQAIRQTLMARLEDDERVMLFGEDIEDPKGDVFGITKELSTMFPTRVTNSPLAEASIVGLSIGQALTGKRPVAFLQFADFLPLAYNQIFSELGSMYWRTNGGWQVPVIIMITSGGYRPGLGPFHANSLETLGVHTPGVNVFMPSTAGDAAALLNAAFESDRPTLFFYPKSCLNNRERVTSPDVRRHIVPLGRARIVRDGDALTFVSWGNTVAICEKAAKTLSENGVECAVIDLRSLMPWDIEAVLQSVRKTGRLIVVHEDNHTAGFGAEVVSTVCERLPTGVEVRRIARPDTYVPCNFKNQLEILPSYKRTLTTAVELIGGTIEWEPPLESQNGQMMIEAIGSSPSDEAITVIEWHINPGDTIESGMLIADLEADKAPVELRASVKGVVMDLLVETGNMVKIGAPLVSVKTSEDTQIIKQVTREEPGTPIIDVLDTIALSRLSSRATATSPSSSRNNTIGIAGISSVTGSRVVDNHEISEMCTKWSAEDIFRRTGIESRRWIDDEENVLTMGVNAVRNLLEDYALKIEDIDLMICCTETPMQNTPSMATLIQHSLKSEKGNGFLAAAYDINAACSGYLYALQIAFDWLTNQSSGRVLIVTTETLSIHMDVTDPSTAPIFGDAATATLMMTNDESNIQKPANNTSPETWAQLFRPVLGANGEDGSLLRVPTMGKGYIHMDGPPVFVEAVRAMTASLRKACAELKIDTDDLSLIIPHQANQRIINAVRQRMKVAAEKVYSNIRHLGNTSSSTIPLCLKEIIGKFSKDEYIGLTAFGGGFTFGGCVLRIV